jgi:hypothetical protein
VFGSLVTTWRKILTDNNAKNPELVGIQKSDFLCLQDALLKKAKLEKLLPAAFAACGLYLLNADEAMKRISSRSIEVELESAVELMGPCWGRGWRSCEE